MMQFVQNVLKKIPMNEQVKKLMLEAGYAAPELAGRANKLAELIIRECAKVVFEKTGPKSALNVLEHFGVEE